MIYFYYLYALGWFVFTLVGDFGLSNDHGCQARDTVTLESSFIWQLAILILPRGSREGISAERDLYGEAGAGLDNQFVVIRVLSERR